MLFFRIHRGNTSPPLTVLIFKTDGTLFGHIYPHTLRFASTLAANARLKIIAERTQVNRGGSQKAERPGDVTLPRANSLFRS